MNDLPPRAWRRWWLEWPRWFRIGCWAAVSLLAAQVLLTIALAIRIQYGLIEPPEIQALRRPGVHIVYASSYRGEPFSGFNRLMDGLKGLSCDDVVAIRLDEHGADADLELIGRSFPNLESLYLSDADVTAAGLQQLSPCRHLRTLDLRGTDIDDSAADLFGTFPQLARLELAGTLIGDETLVGLKQVRTLDWLNVSYTDVTLEAVQAFRAELPTTAGGLQIGTEQDASADGILGSIRWTDGSRSGRFAGSFELRCSGPIVDGRSQGSFATMSSNLTRMQMWWDARQFQGRSDGVYHFTAKLGNCESEPAVVTIENGKPAARTIEFQMSCNRADALATFIK